MARLRRGGKSQNEEKVQGGLWRHVFGIRESELADELGWDRRTLNNYLRGLERQGKAHKDGRTWHADE